MLTGILSVIFAASAQAAGGEGLVANPDHIPWARWQVRVSLDSIPLAWRPADRFGTDANGLKPDRFSLMGDYYFGTALKPFGITGGFRATSGFVVGPSTRHWIDQPGIGAGREIRLGSRLLGPNTAPLLNGAGVDTATLPYLGIGYTGLSPRGGWSFSADLGLMGQAQGVRFGGALNGAQSLDAAIRDLRFAPVLQFGVSYSF
jgi:opacity protein-like surface antigen